MPILTIDGHDYIGCLSIPGLDLSLPVMSQWSYPNLKLSPCRYSGSAYLDNLIIAGHNYQKQFGVLKSLQPGDKLVFTDMDRNTFTYAVSEILVLEPDRCRRIAGRPLGFNPLYLYAGRTKPRHRALREANGACASLVEIFCLCIPLTEGRCFLRFCSIKRP